MVRVPFDAAAVSAEISQRWNFDLQKLFTASVCFWVPFNFLNFALVPPHLRVLPTIFGSVGWSTFLSLTAHRDYTDAEREGDGEGEGEGAQGGL